MSDAERFLALAVSVGDFVASLAERDSGGFRWKTIGYSGEDAYSPEIFSGVSGIAIFLADLHSATGNPSFGTHARGAMAWVRDSVESENGGFGPYRGLYSGMSGHGLAMLHTGRATGAGDLIDSAKQRAVALLGSEYGGCELMYGAAGIGIFLLNCFQEFGDETYLEEALRAGEHIVGESESDGEGIKWSIRLGPSATYQHGMAHGAAGIGYFLAELYRVSANTRFRDAAVGAAGWLRSQVANSEHGASWRRYPDDSELARFQWCHGAPGIGLFFAKTFEITGERFCLDWAIRCGDATRSAGDIKSNPSQCHGLAGNGELLLELGRVTGDKKWELRAEDFGNRAAAYHEGDPPSRRWRSDEPGEFSPDFMLGASGTGHFFLRLANSKEFSMPLMVRP